MSRLRPWLVAAAAIIISILLASNSADAQNANAAYSASPPLYTSSPPPNPDAPPQMTYHLSPLSPEAKGDKATRPWYDPNAKPLATFKEALAAHRALLGEADDNWKAISVGSLCRQLQKVSVACDFNTRRALSWFLAINGKGLFAERGSVNTYAGIKHQNSKLADAIKSNAELFHNGDLSAKEVEKNWR